MSEACPQVREDLGGYVLGALEPDEAERVRAHLERCPECVTEYRELARLPELLDLSAGLDPETVTPPPGLEERLLDSVARESERPRAGRAPPPPRPAAPGGWWGPGPLAALAAAAVIAVVVLGGDDAGEPAARGYEVALTAGPGAPNASARAGLEAVDGGTELHLWVKGLRAIPRRSTRSTATAATRAPAPAPSGSTAPAAPTWC